MTQSTGAGVPEVADWMDYLVSPLDGLIPGRLGRIERLVDPKDVADETLKLLVRDAGGRAAAVAIISSPVAPEMVAHAVNRSRLAREVLGPELGVVILAPLLEGEAWGRSYAVWRYCRPLDASRWVWAVQRAALRPRLLAWLRRVIQATRHEPQQEEVGREFLTPLRRLMGLEGVSVRVRAAAVAAAERLDAGRWSPRYCLMHADLWKGNVLIDSRAARRRRWADRFVIIDWPGSRVRGYAMFDLMRLARSMSLDGRPLRREVEAHCGLLGCETADARSYLSAALGFISMNLGHFPMHQFVRMAENCHDTLDSAGT